MSWITEVTARHGLPAVERGAQLADRHHRQVWAWFIDGINFTVAIDRYGATRWEVRACGPAGVASWQGKAEPSDEQVRYLCTAAGLLSHAPTAAGGQVWSAPVEPDVKKVRDRHGRVWVRSEYTKSSPRWWRGEPGASVPHTWHEMLADYGPLTEVVSAEAVNGR